MEKLYILWTSSDFETLDKMVAMYAVNSLKYKWWDEVEVIIWGASTELVAKDERSQEVIKRMKENGVKLSACKACAKQLEAVDTLEQLGVEVIYWGEKLTKLLKEGAKMLSI